MQRSVRVFPPLHGFGFYRYEFPGPEKTQAGDDEADLEKLQELLVRAPFYCMIAQSSGFYLFYFR